MKSKGWLSYLLDQDIKIGYYSFTEVTKAQLKAMALAKGKEDLVKWYDFDAKDALKRLPSEVKADGCQLLWEDPPFEDDRFNSMPGTRQALGERQKLAQQLNLSWWVSRNYAKANYSELINKISGFGVWVNLPRTCMASLPLEKGHEHRPDDKRVSLLQNIACNDGPPPEKSLLLKVKEVTIETTKDDKPLKFDVAVCETRDIERVQNPERWVKAPKDTSDQDLTQKKTALALIEKEPLKSGEWCKSMIKELKISWSTANRIKDDLKDLGYVTGGGQDRKKPFSITEKGLEYLNE